MNVSAAILSLFIFAFVGCDPAYRIRRDSDQLNYNVSVDCLISSIKSIPNSKVPSDNVESPEYFCKQGQVSRQVIYYIDAKPIDLTACYEGDLLKTFSQNIGGWVGGQKNENVPATLAKMRAVENAIETRCDAEGFSAKIQNNCMWIKCND